MTAESVTEVDDDSPAEPFEIALARALGLPGTPGRVPWAAYETRTLDTACAWFTPAHLEVSMNDVRLSSPAALQLSGEHAHVLLAACAPLLADAGIVLRSVRPDAWLAQGHGLAGLTCWSPRRAAGRSLLPGQGLRADDPAQQTQWLRLFSELEMLLHAHPVNEVRERAGLACINALWVHGAGQLASSESDALSAPGVRVASALADRADDASDEARCALWQALDAGPVADLLAHAQSSASVRLTLCGPRRARTWVAARGVRAYARRWFGRTSVAAALETLCN